MPHPLLERLGDADPAVRRAACREAARDPAAALLAAPLAEHLGDPDAGVAQAAARTLGRLAREAGVPDDALREALRSRDRQRRVMAAFAFAEIEPPGHRILPALVDGLSHPDGDVRWNAARLLVTAGRLHPEVLGMLLGLAGEGAAPAARRMAALCVRELAPDLPEAARALLDASAARDVHLRRAAATAMAALLEPPPAVRRRLGELRDADPDPGVRRLATRALELLDAPR